MEEPIASSNSNVSSPQQRIERDMRALHEAGWIVCPGAQPNRSAGYEVSIPFLQIMRHLAPPQPQAQ
jgi:hypothetical protein